MAKKHWVIAGAALVGGFVAAKMVANKRTENKAVDDGNPYLAVPPKQNRMEHGISGDGTDAEGPVIVRHIPTVYEERIKPVIDRTLSFGGLVGLSPLYAMISLAIVLDDPGPVFFTQKRVGKDKHFFMLHKFRTMKMSAPHDIPTHQLENPDKYITRVGRFLRRTSLDELPQVWDIFRGRMSLIGPRPALWNQADLVAEREKYGVNDVLPGLTGWAQINGRDELEIPVKAKLDGDYAADVSFGMDVKCFAGTVVSVLKSDGVVEGGTGEINKKGAHPAGGAYPGERGQTRRQRFQLRPNVPREAPVPDWGFQKTFHIDTSQKKRVLITGEESYIGESFRAYALEHYGDSFSIDAISLRDERWKNYDFTPYDCIFHVAGIAHADAGKASEEEIEQYYKINTDLAIETARKAKTDGVKQFIFMSSMIIYGGREFIDAGTEPDPANFYGDSKWQADKGVRCLADADFRVAVLRPPMIYGRGSKGNYPVLAKIARKTPVFPSVKNTRSMLYIENLCEFLSLLMLSGEGGIYFPQNAEYSNTAGIVKTVAAVSDKKLRNVGLLNPAVSLAEKMPGAVGSLAGKAFGSSYYDMGMSKYTGLDYQKVGLDESIRRTEHTVNNRVLMLVNHEVVIYNFRLELVERLIHDGYEVHISCPYGERIDELVSLGAVHHDISLDRHGMNPLHEAGLLMHYNGLMKEVRPLIVFGYTVKPNIYGAMAAGRYHIPFVANITGLGTAVENGGVKQKAVFTLYKYSLKNVQKVFFQNKENCKYLKGRGVISSDYEVLPGSGVNLGRNPYEPYPPEASPVIFSTIGRIMRDKGTDELIEAARQVRKTHPEIKFRMIGFFDDEYQKTVEKAVNDGTVEYIGQQKDVHPFIKESFAIIHPSYHEGMSNVLLEAAATGRPVLASDIPGCKETFEEGVSGMGFVPKNVQSLVATIERFLETPYSCKEEMGRAGRKRMEKLFDRNMIVQKYMEEVKKAEQEA